MAAKVEGKSVVEQLGPRGAKVEVIAERKDYTKNIIGVSIGIALIFLFLGIMNYFGSLRLVADKRMFMLDCVVVATAAFMGPYGFYSNSHVSRIKKIERRLPEFLRDVAEAGRFGMTLADAIVVAATGRYGPLTSEIKKMAAQIEWGVPATEALRLFAQRVNTPTVNRITAIIVKSSDAGGSVADVLTMVSHDTREAQLTEDERNIAMGTYLAVVYIAFGVFLVTILILNVTFIPKMAQAGASLSGATQTGVAMPVLIQASVIPDLQFLFIVAAIVHAVGDGILAGVLMNGKVSNGLQHSFLMLVSGYVALRYFMVSY